MTDSLAKVRERIAKNMPAEIPKTLIWEQVSAYALRSQCKNFTIGRGHIDGVLFYELWHKQTMLAVRQPNAQVCKDLAESYKIPIGTEAHILTPEEIADIKRVEDQK